MSNDVKFFETRCIYLTKTPKQNENLKSATACFAKDGPSGGICEVIKNIKIKNIIILTDTYIIH